MQLILAVTQFLSRIPRGLSCFMIGRMIPPSDCSANQKQDTRLRTFSRAWHRLHRCLLFHLLVSQETYIAIFSSLVTIIDVLNLLARNCCLKLLQKVKKVRAKMEVIKVSCKLNRKN